MPKESYLRFEEFLTDSGKTKIVWISSAKHGVPLGTIKWYGRWRQYVFYPDGTTIWNRDCLAEIQDKIGELMIERKRNAQV